MKRTAINPTEWGLQFAMNQAELTEGLTKLLHCAGQTSIVPDADAEMGVSVAHVGDMRGQVEESLRAIDALLEGAGMTRANVLSLRFFTTDVDAFLGVYDAYAEWITAAGIMPPQSVLGVSRLAFPELLIEIEAVAGA
jgi:enamine deaminase RidA (YjgF/YER057c/UK114 family)